MDTAAAADRSLVLVEGRWSTGAGLFPGGCHDLVTQHGRPAAVRQLGADSALWGRDVDDERHLLISDA